jgi:outer membrane protein TolC
MVSSRWVKRPLFAALTWVLAAALGVATPTLPQPGQRPPVYSLDDCLQLALDRNLAILKAQRDIERAQGLVITAKSTLYPQVGLNGRIEERNDDLFSQGTDPNAQRFRDYWTIQLQVIQSLYSGGVNRQRIAMAKLTHEAALIQLQATMNAILQQVKIAVYALVIDQAQVDAQNLTIKLLTEEQKRQKDLFDAGRTTRFNVLRTQVSLGNQQASLSQIQTDLTSCLISNGRAPPPRCNRHSLSKRTSTARRSGRSRWTISSAWRWPAGRNSRCSTGRSTSRNGR